MKIYEQIVEGKIRFPSSSHSFHISNAARNLILALCQTDPTQRLGYVAGGARRVKDHEFFKGTNWEDLYYKRVKGPIIPKVEWAGDSGNFDDYPDPEEESGSKSEYTKDMQKHYESSFKDF